jgi:hypothetical protein
MMNITSVTDSYALALYLAEAGPVKWTVSYATISDATAGIAALVTRSGSLAGPTASVELVTGVAGSTKQVKNINVINKSGGPVTISFFIGQPE